MNVCYRSQPLWKSFWNDLSWSHFFRPQKPGIWTPVSLTSTEHVFGLCWEPTYKWGKKNKLDKKVQVDNLYPKQLCLIATPRHHYGVYYTMRYINGFCRATLCFKRVNDSVGAELPSKLYSDIFNEHPRSAFPFI